MELFDGRRDCLYFFGDCNLAPACPDGVCPDGMVCLINTCCGTRPPELCVSAVPCVELAPIRASGVPAHAGAFFSA